MTSYHGWTHAPKEMGGTDPIPFTGAIYHFVVFEDIVPVVAGDSAFIFHIPADLDGMRLAEVEINVETASSSGIVQVQLHNMEQAVDILSTRVQVDSGELHSRTASTAYVINTANATVAHGDRIRVDVDAAGTGTLGLDVVLRYFTVAGFSLRGPAGATGDTGPQGDPGDTGPQGDPGGITAWEGAWTTSTGYSIGDAVSHNGSSYASRTNHTSGASSEPGVGASWETDWMLLAAVGEAGAAGVGADGWVLDGNILTYASATTFTTSGDLTAVYSKGTRIKLTQTTVKYFVVVASSHAGGTTTVTITGGSDYTLANAAIDDPFYSYSANPEGYPGWFNFAPTYTGFSADPSGGKCQFNVIGTLCTFRHARTAGTSNATTFTLTLPIASADTTYMAGRAMNNGTIGSAPALVAPWFTSATVCDVFRDFVQTAWTNSGSKNCDFTVIYPI